VSFASKGEKAVQPAVIAGWEFIHQILLALSLDDQRALAGMLETVKYQLDSYLHPEMDMAEIAKNSLTNDPHLYKRMAKNLLPADYEAKRKHGNMTVDYESENTVLRLWLLLRRVGEILTRCQDLVFLKYGLSTEKWGVVVSIKSRGPLRPSDLSMMQARTPNSMSMLIDRMVKTGLVRRTRDRKDRRVVTVSLTSKAEAAVEPAVIAGWEFINEILSPLSDNEQRTLANMLEAVKAQLVAYLHPEMDKAAIIKNSFTNDPDLYKRMAKNLLPSGYELKRKHRNKPKLVHETAA
jgi:MarR family 2-MHQ and catechol resistance regulon transcriptional repressor